jgi:hypothetical protein
MHKKHFNIYIFIYTDIHLSVPINSTVMSLTIGQETRNRFGYGFNSHDSISFNHTNDAIIYIYIYIYMLMIVVRIILYHHSNHGGY